MALTTHEIEQLTAIFEKVSADAVSKVHSQCPMGMTAEMVQSFKEFDQSWRAMKRHAFSTFVKLLVTFLLGALAIGIATKLGIQIGKTGG